MRTLKFIIDGLIIKPDPNCDFTNLVPGTDGYLKAEFSFSPEWRGYVKVAAFYSVMGKEYAPQMIGHGTTCDIPREALCRKVFKIQVIGKNSNGNILKTNRLEVKQDGGIA